MMTLILATLCVADCPTRMMHIQAISHTQGGKCRSCSAKIDVCYVFCDACAKDRCPGCGGSDVKIESQWKNERCGDPASGILRLLDRAEFAREWARLGLGEETPQIDFTTHMVLVLVRGRIHDSARTRSPRLREFDDRLELTYSYTTPQCGNEETFEECVFLKVPRSGKELVVRAFDEARSGNAQVVATLDPLK